MTDAGPGSEEPATELDSKLRAEAHLYKVDYAAYSAMSPRERSAVKMRWARARRNEAARRRVDPDEFLAMTEEQREAVRLEHPERPVVLPRKRRSIDDVAAVHTAKTRPEPASYVDEGLSRGDDDVETYSSGAAVPATEGEPEKRDRPTLGDVRPVGNEDLVGWVQPQNLLDVYARYTIGDGQHFIRVERVEPKVFQTFSCAGYLGEIREPMTEEEFAVAFGGRSYLLQVYGPDPKGRQDVITGRPLIKPKTDRFRYTVPVLGPNLRALPGVNAKKGTDPMQSSHPMFGQAGLPTTPADAAMHKSTLDFVSTQLQRSEQTNKELRERLDSKGNASADVLEVVAGAGKSAIEATERATAAREQALMDIISGLRADNKALHEKIDRINDAPRESSMKDVAEVLKVTSPAQNMEQQLGHQRAQHAEEIARLKESHRDQIETLRSNHKDALDNEKKRHEEEIKRIRERADQDEKMYRMRVEDVEKQKRDREQELRDQMNELRREEIARADQRVKDTEKMFEGRIVDLKERHAAEIRMMGEQHTTRVDTTKSTFEMQIANHKEREKRLAEELAEAKEEAASAGDPVQILEKQKNLAEALGYKKEDDSAPTTPGERFAALAGMGAGKALETIGDWGPEIARAFSARGARPAMGGPPGQALPPGPGMRPPQRPAPQRPNRVVAWATQNSIPIDQQPVIPPGPVAAPVEPASPPAPSAPSAQAAPPAPPPSDTAPATPQNGHSGNRFSAHFPDAVIDQFRQQVEMAINAGMPSAEEFARRFLELDVNAAMVMVTQHKSEEFIETVKAMTGAGDSAILRPDGKRWVQALWREVPIQYKRAVDAQQAAGPAGGQPS